MSPLPLRDYQPAALGHVRRALAGGRPPCYVSLPTGTGKTVILAELARELTARGRVLVVGHRRELIAQLAAAMSAAGRPSGGGWAGGTAVVTGPRERDRLPLRAGCLGAAGGLGLVVAVGDGLLAARIGWGGVALPAWVLAWPLHHHRRSRGRRVGRALRVTAAVGLGW